MLSSWHKRDLLAVDVCMDAPDTPDDIEGDATTLREAVKNVLGNALLHGAPGLLHVAIVAVGVDWEVRFIDDGPGIPVSEHAARRQPFSPPQRWPRGRQPGAVDCRAGHGGAPRRPALPARQRGPFHGGLALAAGGTGVDIRDLASMRCIRSEKRAK